MNVPEAVPPMVCVPVPVKNTARLLAVKLALSVRFPETSKSPPTADDNVVVAVELELPLVKFTHFKRCVVEPEAAFNEIVPSFTTFPTTSKPTPLPLPEVRVCIFKVLPDSTVRVPAIFLSLFTIFTTSSVVLPFTVTLKG